MKLCVPFPKVEPPEIFPHFDQDLYLNWNVEEVEKKPEAPWIHREQNSIRFTEKIETYSKLEMEESEQ